jgi:alkaline phosphatase D
MRTTEGPGGRRLSRAEFLRLSGATATMKFYNARRGYVLCDVIRDRWQSDFQAFSRVSTADDVSRKIARFVSEAGVPGLHPE